MRQLQNWRGPAAPFDYAVVFGPAAPFDYAVVFGPAASFDYAVVFEQPHRMADGEADGMPGEVDSDETFAIPSFVSNSAS